MKTIVYLADGSIECTARADEFVNRGIARYATAKESGDYERRFEMEALAPLVSVICHFPASYSETNCRVCGLKIGSKGGADTISLDVRKGLDDAAKEFKFKTPERLLAHPSEEGTYTPPLKDDQAALVYSMIEEAKAYIRGDRAQGVLPVLGDTEEGEEAEDENQTKIDLTGVQDEKPKRTRKPKSEAATA